MTTTIFENGNLKPGIYKIQNIYTETFLDIEVHSREMCCRPKRDLGEGRGLVRSRYQPPGVTYLTIGSGKSNGLEMGI